MSDRVTPATYVINNSLIVDKVISHLDQLDFVQLCLVRKQTWQLAITHLWMRPLLHSVEQFELFARSAATALPFELRSYQHYGDLLHDLDLSMVVRRWDKLSYESLAPVFKHCVRLERLDLSLCQHLLGAQFENLFADNPRICASLTFLDISETTFCSHNLIAVLTKLPGITALILGETSTDDSVLEAISKHMPCLEWLEIDSCESVSDLGIKAIFEGCPKLAYLSTRECWGVLDTDVIAQINARGGWEDIEVLQDYDEGEQIGADDYESDTFYEYNYDNEDPDFYATIARQLQRNL
ncbi:hypothetical protein GGI21_002892 [Coemansia aciculifera]|nr:hypothetical protein GGI21_002892 [Coemansia aciculifera]